MPEFDWDHTPIGVAGVTALRFYLRWLAVVSCVAVFLVAACLLPHEWSASLAIVCLVTGVWYLCRVRPWLRYHRYCLAQKVLDGRCSRCDADVVKTLTYGLRACPGCGAELEPVSRLEKDRAAQNWKKRRRHEAALRHAPIGNSEEPYETTLRT